MSEFYFTYGSSHHFPFQDGWTKIIAEDMWAATELFKKHHPHPQNPDWLNCAFCYTEDEFKKTRMYTQGNFHQFCHEVITQEPDE